MTCDDLTVAVAPSDAVPSSDPRWRPGALLGRYVLVGPIGRGGMGVVWSAYDPELDRRVALKVIRRDISDDLEACMRLVAEAKALARLSHPNVVTVYDVCSVDDQIALAMELVDGVTLVQWLNTRRRGWREILDVFVLAGRGLAAAHDAGVVHRDFKPANVMIAGQSSPSVRVLDFGLAQPMTRTESSGSGGDRPVPDEWSSLDRMTRPGLVVGTPRYMSPEQRFCRPVDARSDQFSFCVALWEALFDELPFPTFDTTPRARAADSRTHPSGGHRAAAESRSRRVPGWLRVALHRGLATEPDDRFDSMASLLAMLGRDPAARRRRWGLAAAAVTLVAAAAGVAAAPTDPCAIGAARWDDVWSDERRAQGERAFADLGAEASWDRVATALDDYGEAWRSSHREACVASLDRDALAAFDHRMSCLQRAHRAAGALADLLVVADATTARNAVLAVDGLPAVAACEHIDPRSTDPFATTDPARASELQPLLAELARVDALLVAGQWKDARAPADALVETARALDHGPLLAEALFAQGRALVHAEAHEQAIAVFEESEHLARAHAHDELVPIVIDRLVYLLGYKLGRNDEALAWGRHGLAAAERVAEPAGPRGRLLVAIGNAHEGRAEYERARANYTEALALLAEAYGPDSPYVARAMNSLGNAQYQLAEVDAAGESYRRAHEIWSQALGEDHPDAVIPLNNWARIEMRNGRLEEGRRMAERVLDVWTRAYGPDYSLLTLPLGSLAEVSRDLERWDDAVRYDERALALYEAKYGPEHPNATYPLYGLGMSHYFAGRFAQAQPFFARALAIGEQVHGPEDPRLCLTLDKLALVAVELGQGDRAVELATRALRIGERAFAPDNPNLARYHYTLGEVWMRLGEPERAVPHLKATIDLRPGPTKYHPDEIGGPLFELAQAYRTLGHHRHEVIALAEAAAIRYDAWGLPAKATRIRAWSRGAPR